MYHFGFLSGVACVHLNVLLYKRNGRKWWCKRGWFDERDSTCVGAGCQGKKPWSSARERVVVGQREGVERKCNVWWSLWKERK